MREGTVFEISFYRYAAIVKNLRGVIYWSGEHEQRLKWLLSRFKYRSLGLPPSLASRVSIKRKTLVTLPYPSKEIAEAASVLSRVLGEKEAEALCLASAYISPLMVVGAGLDRFAAAVVDKILTDKELSDRDWKLHMRIADYTVLDLYAWSLESSARALFEGRAEEELKSRREAIVADKKRYWRVASNEGRPLLGYLDPLKAAYDAGLLDELRSLGRDVVAALGIVAALVI